MKSLAEIFKHLSLADLIAMRDECETKRKDAEVKLENVSESLEDLTLDIRKYGLLEDFADGEIRKRIDSIYNSIPLKQQLKYFKSFE